LHDRISARFQRTMSSTQMLSRRGLVCSVVFLVLCPILDAQSPNPAATAPNGGGTAGFVSGWTLGLRFEGSSSSDGTVYDVGTAVGRNFTRHFGIDFGVPFYFIGTPSSTKQSNPGAASGIGIGNAFSDLRLNYPDQFLNFSSIVHLTAPTGDTAKGLSTGHATWNLANHVDHAFGDFSPFLDAAVGNTILDTRYFHRPFISFGYNAAFDGGLEYDPGQFSFTLAAYDVVPWGNQTMISRVFRCGKSTHCSASPTTNRKNYNNASVSVGGADLVRDNGFNAGIDFKPTSHLDLEFDYSRSLPLQLNILSFGVGVDLSWLLHPSTR
jgi:hypothetical protein